MKRFISALSSLCLAATSVFSAFPALTASAASTITIKGDTVAAQAGETVTAGFAIYNDPGTAGMQLKFDFDGLNVSSYTLGDAYKCKPQWNDDDCIFTWGGNKEFQATDGSHMVYFDVKIPSNPKSAYKITLDSSDKTFEQSVVNVDGAESNIDFTAAVINVEGGTTGGDDTPSGGSDAPVSGYTLQLVNANGSTTYKNGKNYTTAKVGEEVTLNMIVNNDPGTAGIQLMLDFAGLDAEMVKGDAYKANPTWNPDEGILAFTPNKGNNATAADGKSVVSFNIKPTAKKQYNIGLDNSDSSWEQDITDQDGKSMKFSFIGIVVDASDGTTTGGDDNPGDDDPGTDTPVSGYTLQLVNANGSTTYKNGKNYTAVKTGEEVTLNMIVNNDPGTAGIQLMLDFAGLDAEMVKGDAYKANPTWNPDEGILAFTPNKGNNATAADGKTVVSFNITPTTKKQYTIGLDNSDSKWEHSITDQDGKELKYTFIGIVVDAMDDVTPITTTKVTPGATGLTYELVNAAGNNTVKNGQNYSQVKAGESVTVDLIVKNDPGTAGIQFKMDLAGLSATVLKGNAYKATPTWNGDEGILTFLTNKGTNVTVADGTVIASFVVTPSAEKQYKLGLDNSDSKWQHSVEDESGKIYDFDFVGLVLDAQSGTVDPGTDPGTSDDDPGTETPIDGYTLQLVNANGTTTYKNNANYSRVNVGEEVTVNMIVNNDPGTAGIQLKLDFAGLDATMVKGDAYKANPTWNPEEGILAFTPNKGNNATAADGKTVVSFNVTLPAAKQYAIGLDNSDSKWEHSITDEDGKELKYTFIGIVLDGTPAPVTTTKAEETDPVIPAGKAGWTIAKVEAAAGAKVSVPVTVSGDEGTSGFVATFKIADGLSFLNADFGGAYSANGSALINGKELTVVWAADNGGDVKAADGSTVVTLNFTAPTAAGTYAVEFADLKVVNTSGEALNVEKTNGAVVVNQSSTAGSATWTINTVTAEKGATVKVPVIVSKDQGTSGITVDFTYNSALKLQGIEWGTAYAGEALINTKEAAVVWANDKGSDDKATDNAVVLNLVFTAPNAAGTYEVSFGDLKVVNTDGAPLTITKVNGSVIVTSGDEPVDPVVNPGKAGWDIAEVNAAKGANVSVPVFINADEGTAGIVAEFKADSALTFNSITWGTAYTGDALVNNAEKTFVWASDDANDQKAADGSIVAYLNFTAPNAAGVYKVEFADLKITNTSGKALTVATDNGSVTVTDDEPVVTTTVTTPSTGDTTTTSVVIPAGYAAWFIGEKTVAPGAKVAVPVSVSKDQGTAGFNVTFNAASELTFDGFTWGDAYTSEPLLNKKELTAVWSADDGNSQKAADDAVVLYLNFTAPTTAGKYAVNFGDISVVDTNGKKLDLITLNGFVEVQDTTVTTVSENPTQTTTVTNVTPADVTSTSDNGGSSSDNTTSTVATDAPIPGTTEATTPIVIEPGFVGWIIGNKTVTAGEKVAIPVTIQQDQGTAGFGVTFNAKAGITFDGITWGDAYTGSALVNNKEFTIVWASDNGNDQKASDGAVVAYLNFTVPADAAVGKYDITFADLKVVNTDGGKVSTFNFDGFIEVVAPTTTPAITTTVSEPVVTTTVSEPVVTTTSNVGTDVTTTVSGEPTTTTSNAGTDVTTTVSQTPTTTTSNVGTEVEPGTTVSIPKTDPTTTNPSASGYVGWFIDKVNGVVGEEVKLPITVQKDPGTAAFNFTLDIPEGLTLKAVEWGNAYTGKEQLMVNLAEKTIVWDNKSGANQTAEDDAVVVYLVLVPTATGVFPVSFKEINVADSDGQNLSVFKTDGSVTVTDKPVTTTTIVTTVSATAPVVTTTVNTVVSGDVTTISEDGKITITTTVGTDVTNDVTTVSEDGKTTTTTTVGTDVTTTVSEDGKTTTTTTVGTDVITTVSEDGKTTTTTTVGTDVTTTVSGEPTTTTSNGGTDVTTTVSGEPTTTTSNGGTDVTTTVSEGQTTTTSATNGGDEPGVTTTVVAKSNYSISFKEPGRVYYWSHDERAFNQIPDGLNGMQVMMTVEKWFEDAQGNIVDENGNAAEKTVKTLDITEMCSTDIASPKDVYATVEHTVGVYEPDNHKFVVPVSYDSSKATDKDFVIGEGETVKVGDFKIFIGLKGDITLDEKVSEYDATTVLKFYASISLLTHEYYELNADEDLQKLAFYLGDVAQPMGMDENSADYDGEALYEYYYNLTEFDATAILRYYAYVDVMGEEPGHDSWVYAAGFDFPDEVNLG